MRWPFVKDKPWPEKPYRLELVADDARDPAQPPRYQVYPMVLYHPKLAPDGQPFFEAEETIGLKRKGWVDSPAKFPKPSRLKLWWAEWEWLFKLITVVGGCITAIAGIVTAIVTLIRAIHH